MSHSNEASTLKVVDGNGQLQEVVADEVHDYDASSSSSSDGGDKIFRPRNSSYGLPGKVVDPTSGLATDILRAPINVISSGPNVLVEEVAGKRIVVIALLLQAKSEVDIYLQSGGDAQSVSSAADFDEAICFSSAVPLTIDSAGSGSNVGGLSLPPNHLGHMESANGEALVLNSSANVGISGCLSYVLLDPLP